MSSLLVICKIDQYEELRRLGDIPEHLLVWVTDPSGIRTVEAKPLIYCICPDSLDEMAEKDEKAFATFISRFFDKMVVSLVIHQKAEADQPISSTLQGRLDWHEKFHQKVKNQNPERIAHFILWLIFVAKDKIGANEYNDFSSLIGDKFFRSSFVMLDQLEEPDDHTPLYSSEVWPIAVSRLLVVASIDSGHFSRLTGKHLWKTLVIWPETEPGSAEENRSRFFADFHESIQEIPDNERKALKDFFSVSTPSVTEEDKTSGKIPDFSAQWESADLNQLKITPKTERSVDTNAIKKIAKARLELQKTCLDRYQKYWQRVSSCYPLVFANNPESDLPSSNLLEDCWNEVRQKSQMALNLQAGIENRRIDLQAAQRGFLPVSQRLLAGLTVSLAVSVFFFSIAYGVFQSTFWGVVSVLSTLMGAFIAIGLAWTLEHQAGKRGYREIREGIQEINNIESGRLDALRSRFQSAHLFKSQAICQSIIYRVVWLTSRLRGIIEQSWNKPVNELLGKSSGRKEGQAEHRVACFRRETTVTSATRVNVGMEDQNFRNLRNDLVDKWNDFWREESPKIDRGKNGGFPARALDERITCFSHQAEIERSTKLCNLVIRQAGEDWVRTMVGELVRRTEGNQYFSSFSAQVQQKDISGTPPAASLFLQAGLPIDVFTQCIGDVQSGIDSPRENEYLSEFPWIGILLQTLPAEFVTDPEHQIIRVGQRVAVP